MDELFNKQLRSKISHRIFLLLTLFILFYESTIFAQNKYTFSQFANETVDFIKQPLNWEKDDYLKLGLITIGGGLTMFADQPIRNAVLKDQRYYKSVPIEFGRMYGELYSPVIFFSSFALYSLITDDVKARKIAYEIGQASLYGGAINFLLKVGIGRARPNVNNNTEGAGVYRPFFSIFNDSYHSLPGGHSTVAFTISTVLSRNVKPVWLKVLIYVPAVLTMTSRVYQNFHWTSDCLIGAAFGYFVGTWVVDKHEKVVKSDAKKSLGNLLDRIHLQPFIGDFSGLILSIRLL